VIEAESEPHQGVTENEGGTLLAALRVARSARIEVEIAAVRGDTSARCALSLLPDGLFVVHCCAEWDESHAAAAASLRRLAYLPGWQSYRCDVDRDPDLALALEVTAVPTLIAFHQGREVARLIGGQEEVEAWLLVQRAEVLG